MLKCRRTLCTESFPPERFLEHEEKCRLGLFSEQIELTTHIDLPFIPNPIKETLTTPKSIASFMPEHLKSKEIAVPENQKAHSNQWYEKMNLWACLSHLKDENPDDPLLRPIAIRSIANFSLRFWDATKQTQDPTHPLSEGEQFIQHLVGFDPIIGEKIDPSVIKPRPHLYKWSDVPFYLLSDSEEWVKIACGLPPRYVPQAEKVVAPDSGNELMPCVRINPLERISQEQIAELIRLAELHFPSLRSLKTQSTIPTCMNPRQLINRRNKLEVAIHNFHRITTINMPKLKEKTEKLILKNTEIHPKPETTFCVHMAYCRIDGVSASGTRDALRPRPIWVVIVDGYRNIVYESLVHHDNVTRMDTPYHGLTLRDIKHAKSFISVRDQILTFFLTATAIVGSGLINMMRALDLTDSEIYVLQHKFREITQYFSPYIASPASLSLVSFLLLPAFTLRAEAHSPAIEAITGMNLYMGHWQEIEAKAIKFHGIHHANMAQTCGNRKVSKLLQIYRNRVANNEARWPSNWAYVLRNKDFDFKAPCATPASSSDSSEYSNYGSECNVSVHSYKSSSSSSSNASNKSKDSTHSQHSPHTQHTEHSQQSDKSHQPEETQQHRQSPEPQHDQEILPSPLSDIVQEPPFTPSVSNILHPEIDLNLLDLADDISKDKTPPLSPIKTEPLTQSPSESVRPQSSQSTISPPSHSAPKKRKQEQMEVNPVEENPDENRHEEENLSEDSPVNEDELPPPMLELYQAASPSSTIESFLNELQDRDSRSSISQPNTPQSNAAQLSPELSESSSSGTEDSESSSSSSSPSPPSTPTSNRYQQGKVLPYALPPSPFERRQYHSDTSRVSFTSTGSSASGLSQATVQNRQISSSQVRSDIFYPTRQRSSSRDSSQSNP